LVVLDEAQGVLVDLEGDLVDLQVEALLAAGQVGVLVVFEVVAGQVEVSVDQ